MAGIAAYWAYACECEYWATNMHDEQDRQIFLEMAGAWSELALKQQSAFQNTGTRPLLDKRGGSERAARGAYPPITAEHKA